MNLTYWADGHIYVHKCSGSARTTRVLAHPDQLPLLKKLENGYVEVCSVNQLDNRRSFEPDYVLECMSKVSASPDQGGWRPLGQAEFAALQFEAPTGAHGVFSLQGRKFTDALRFHPLVRSGVGYATNDIYSIGLFNLMSEIYDIRRFSHPIHPNRSGRLRSYFRLAGPQHVLSLYDSEVYPSPGLENRTAVVVGSWFMFMFVTMSREAIEAHPPLFLYREYFKHYENLLKGETEMKARGLAMWRSTLRYLTFIHQLWLAAVSDDYVFDPGRFFDTSDEASSFQEYIDWFDTPVDNLDESM